jgi:hypothetical protein
MWNLLGACSRGPFKGNHRNPPSPPFAKGGSGGFETYFLTNSNHKISNQIQMTNVKELFDICLPEQAGILAFLWHLKFVI